MDQIAYRLKVEKIAGEATARFGDIVLAASQNARLMRETRAPATVYFPLEDVQAKLIARPEKRTFCPFKGTAHYFDVDVGGTVIEAGAWSYETALPEAEDISGFICFSADTATETTFADPETAAEPEEHISGPLVDWLLRQAWQCQTPEELIEEFAAKLNENGVDTMRIGVFVWSLHPLIVGHSYFWENGEMGVVSRDPTYDLLHNPAFLDSPMRHVTDGLGGVRQRLNDEPPEFNFPILDDLREKGATDYVAMPFTFSDGQTNVITFATARPEGFHTSELGLVYELTSVLSRYFETFMLKEKAETLLSTYLGQRTGKRVLGGEIRRGYGEEIEAAVFICDLRNSTRLEEELGRDAYLEVLNCFFDKVTDAVVAEDGEVLKFMGDAVLATFSSEGDPQVACQRAVRAAKATVEAVCQLDIPNSDTCCDSAVGIAYGEVTYGNIGAGERLDFTVIGAAANRAARVGDLGKKLGERILVTHQVGEVCHAAAGVELIDLGDHELHNVSGPVGVYAVR